MTAKMKRREFISLLGGAAAAWPLAARAQPGRLPIIGFLGGGTRDSARTWVAAFEQRLRELGWTEGRTVTIRYRWAEGHNERMAEIAAEFVRIKANVVAVYGTQAALAAKQATADIPIVFTLPGDPVGTGLVASLARPGGNVTGLSSQTTDLSGKRLEVLREIVPGLRRLAIMVNVDNPANAEDMKETQAMARAAGLDVATFEIRRTEDIAPAFANLKGPADALYVAPDALMTINRLRRRYMGRANTWRPQACSPMGRIFPTCSDAREIMSIKFCGGRNPPTFRLSNRPSATL